jgi:hypothetical protein
MNCWQSAWTLTPGRRAEAAFWFAVSILVAGLFGVPLLLMTYCNADYLTIANEALAATYFTCERLAHGEGGTAWLPHGHILGLVQRVILSIVHQVAGGGADALQQRVNLFAGMTSLANVLFMSAILVTTGMSRTLRRSDKLLVFWSAVVPVYATGGWGFWFSVQPAYYQLDMVLVTVAVAVFLWQLRAPPSLRPKTQAALLGGLVGLMMSNKITMGLVGTMVLAPVLWAPPVSARRTLGRALVAGVAAIVTMLGVSWALYGFRLHALCEMLVRYSAFAANPGGEEGFWTQIIWSACRECHLHWIVLCWVLSALTAVVAGVYAEERPWFGRTVTFLNLFCGAACGLALVKRPAGTMLFEVVVMLAGLSAMAIGAISLSRLRRGVTLVATLGAIALAAMTHPWTAWIAAAQASHAQAAEMWGMQRDILRIAAGRRIVVLFPDNSYAFGGVPEFLLKGAAICATCEIRHGGQRILRELAPGMEFRVGSGAIASPFPDNSLIVWFDPCWHPPLTERYPLLQNLNHQPGTLTWSWEVTGLVKVRAAVSRSPQAALDCAD